MSFGLHAQEDWPMWRADATRSAATSNQLPDEFKFKWGRQFDDREQAWDDPLNLDLMTYDRVFEPIVYQGLVCIGFNDQDKLLALDAETGEQRWTHYAEGPVRLPPVGWNGHVYFCSDDGFLYCVRASDGELVWRFQGAPKNQHAIGNQRLISAWPARGGPVIRDGTVYFAASIWPFMGTFIYALDAETGEPIWINDRTGSQYIKQPHSAPSFAGVAPQGAMVATDRYLVVPGGRSVPAVFDRQSGDLKYFEINAGGKGTGGSFVSADDLHYYVHTREKGTRAFNLETGVKTAFTPNEGVLYHGHLFSAETDGDEHWIRAYRVDDEDNSAREPIWEIAANGAGDLILAGQTLVAAHQQTVTLVELPPKLTTESTPKVSRTFEVPGLQDGESIARLLVADRTLFVVGDSGSVGALGKNSNPANEDSKLLADNARFAAPNPDAEVSASATLAKKLASRILNLAKPDEAPLQGYALWFGRCDEPLLRSIATQSPFVQLAIIDDAAESSRRVMEMREWLDRYGLLGKVTVHVSAPEHFHAPSYVAHSVYASQDAFDEKSAFESRRVLESIYKSVRPYGGKLVLLPSELAAASFKATTETTSATTSTGSPEETISYWNALVDSADLEQATAEWETISLDVDSSQIDRSVMVVRRAGALPGSADWTHQYGDISNSLKSNDTRVKLPLGILWFGGSSNMDVLPRHGHGPPEQVVGGRLFIQGMNSLSARDVYTGRVIWKREFQDLGTYDVYYDATYEDTPLNPQYNQVHIPGANGRGTNYVVTDDVVYLLVGASCLMIDPATGEDIGKIEMPVAEDGSQPEWGYLGVYGEILLGGIGFANYRERYELDFDADADLKRNRAGFGSKSFDRAASRGLIAFDRHSGEKLWQVDANHSFWHNGIIAGGGRVYCLDRNPTQVEQAMRRRGLSLPDTYRIVSLDPQNGKTKWEIKEGIFGTWLGYSAKHDLLLQAGAQASDRLYAEVGQGMRTYRAASGELHWKKDNLKYAGPCILHNDLIITNANSYSESAGAFFLATGEQKMVKHPITGKTIPWKMTRAYGCNNIIASENLLTFRSGAAGYYDLNTNSGTGNLGGFKSGCTSNLVVANGVLNAPDYTRTCSCSYQNQTSLALVHMPGVEVWSVNALASAEVESAVSDEEMNVASVGFNFGAAGDRRDQDGILWLEYPATAGESPPFGLQYNSDATVYSQHSVSRSEDPRSWIASSGLENVRELSVSLSLQEPQSLEDGIRVSHADDDAEETETGMVDLSSSDLELTFDDGNQTIGLRFDSVPLSKDAEILEAYLQFTCDEAGDQPTSLWIAGEKTPNASRFSSNSHDVTSRDRTQSEVRWAPPAWTKPGDSSDAQKTPNLAAIIQEIVNQPTWENGNAISFLIGGEGQRTAVSSKGSNKDAAKLIVIADTNLQDQPSQTPARRYDVELVFAAPRGSTEPRVFDIYLQDQLIGESITVPADNQATSQKATVLKLSNVEIGNDLELRFEAKQSTAVLSGIRLIQSDIQSDTAITIQEDRSQSKLK